ncbi:hypothetical protein ACFYO1_34585 [Nocardia sp. NPDC006044]|uniref:hypothetical protein n=1 Tax=Nocardia sp. NPDC006044 TaxID=3364306 RepID=UPI00367FEEA5
MLAWTSGAAPMLWFVSVSDKAVGGNAETRPAAEAGASTPASRPGADIVFFRAPAGFNSFPYSATKEGFLTSHPAKPERVHGITTMFHLARWLLRPQPPTVIAAEVARVKTAGGLPVLPELMGMRLVPKTSPPPRIDPPEPLDMVAEDVRWAFRPVGVEEALRHAPAEDIAVLPLGFDGFGELPRGGYAALAKPDSLAPVLRSIWSLLWMRGAVHIKDTTTPARNSEIWLLGNSGANISMSNCLTKNAASVDRFISCDATPAEATKTEAGNLVPAVIPAIKRATEVRKGLSKTLEVFMITTPNMWNSKAAYEHRKAQIKDSKASVSYLPADAEWDDYWKYPPTATSNPLLFEVLSNWDGHGLDKSHQFGTAHGRQFLFWHEWSVDGGHLELVPNPPPAPPTPRVRSWLEQILQM